MRKVIRLPRLEFRNEYFLFLLPLFFVVHGYNENWGRIPLGDALLLLLQYELLLGIWVLVFFFAFRSFHKAALFSFALGCFYFFFGAAHDWLKEVAPGTIVVKYTFIIPITFLALAGLFVYLKKGHLHLRLVSYLNVLFLFLSGVELVLLLLKEVPHQDIIRQATVDNRVKDQLKPCDTCSKEDIHLIILDEYAGATQLKEVFRFDNTPFLDSLRARRFRIIGQSTSNYNFSPISMASMFSLDYLHGVGKWPDYELVDVAAPILNRNLFVDFLQRQHYTINNISIFDINGVPAYKKEFDYGTSPISDHTFWSRLDRDMGYHLITAFQWQHAISNQVHAFETEAAKNTSRMAQTVKAVKAHKGDQPQFYYTHLMIPHGPFVLDRNGHSVGLNYYLDPQKDKGFKRGYLEYLQYCNKIMLPFLDTLIKNAPRPPVIILMSDHGFRHPTVAKNYHFMTLNAVLLPDGRYTGFYDGMSNVNQLRVLLNNRFGQQLPLLKDSAFFLGWPGM